MSEDELIKHPQDHIKDIVKHWKKCNTNLEIYSKRNEVKASRLKTFDKALRASMLLCSSASAYVVTLWPTGNSTIKNTHELKGTFLAETVLGLSTAFLSGLIAFLGLTTTITEYEKTASRYDCYRERCTSGYSDCNRVIVKYCEKHKVFDDELSVMREHEVPIERIRETEKRKRNLDSEWRNTALELNAIYSTWAQTVYDKQKDLPSRLPPRMCDSCSDKLEHVECPKCRQPMEDGAHAITHDFSNILIDDGEESE
jgi:hypothetical protein